MSASKEASAWGMAIAGGVYLLLIALIGVPSIGLLVSTPTPEAWASYSGSHAFLFGVLLNFAAAGFEGAWIARRRRRSTAPILGVAAIFALGLLCLFGAVGGFSTMSGALDVGRLGPAATAGASVWLLLAVVPPTLLALAGLWTGALLFAGRRRPQDDRTA